MKYTLLISDNTIVEYETDTPENELLNSYIFGGHVQNENGLYEYKDGVIYDILEIKDN